MYQNCAAKIMCTEIDLICTEVVMYQYYPPLCTEIDLYQKWRNPPVTASAGYPIYPIWEFADYLPEPELLPSFHSFLARPGLWLCQINSV